ncbi:hypothetical protein [Noviherbaspirillum agri]
MDILLSIIGALWGWRFLASLSAAVAIAIPVGHVLGPVAGFSLALFGVGFGCIWQGRWLSGIPLLASVPSPPISKPVTFLGLSFIGALWGGFSSEVLGSGIEGAFVLVAAVALGTAWRTVVLKQHTALGGIVFFAASLLFGLGAVYALGMLRA